MLKKHWVFVVCLIVFLALLAKNPFSQRTLIPNFEPYPDTIHYIVPARSLVSGDAFEISREGRYVKPGVPPLYSMVLVPFFLVHNDPRMFYFANVALSIAAFALLYLILKKITNKPALLFLALFLYATNYFIYWYPSLAMAETLTLFIFLLNLYLLMVPVNKVMIILGSVIPFGFILTKYANAPLTAVFLAGYAWKLWSENGKGKAKAAKRRQNLKWFGISLGVTLLVLLVAEVFPPLTTLTSLFSRLLPGPKTATRAASGGGEWFSVKYIGTNLPQYLHALIGGYRLRFLWDDTPIWPVFVALPGLIGLVVGAFIKKIRLPAIALLLGVFINVLFMSTFYALDMRYLNYVIPALLIGFVILVEFLFQKKIFQQNERLAQVVLYSILALLFVFYSVTNAVRLKKQVMLNLKYAETPWYYISVLKLNDYFKNYPQNKKAPVVVTAMIPYFVDFYTNDSYSLLPMSLNQDFRNFKKEAWGNFDYSDLNMLYEKIIYTGHEVYLTNGGMGNDKTIMEDYKKIRDFFILKKVADGCYGACDIWKLDIKYPLLKKVVPKDLEISP